MRKINPFTYSGSIQGVQVMPTNEDGKKLSVRYKGVLANSHNKNIIIHYGFGKEDNWEKVWEKPLFESKDGWEVDIVMLENSQLNFCFRDNEENWDNNNGFNWIYKIS